MEGLTHDRPGPWRLCSLVPPDRTPALPRSTSRVPPSRASAAAPSSSAPRWVGEVRPPNPRAVRWRACLIAAHVRLPAWLLLQRVLRWLRVGPGIYTRVAERPPPPVPVIIVDRL